MTTDRSILRVGGLAAFGVAVSYVASGLVATLMPAELQGRPDVSAHEFWMVLAAEPTAHLAFHWTWVAIGIFGVMTVPAISLFVWRSAPATVLWTGVCATYAFAVMMRSHLMEIAFDRKVIPLYRDAEPAFQQAVQVVAGLALDVPDGFLTYGAIGIWVVAVSAVGGRAGMIPSALSRLGYAAGATYFAGVVGYTFLVRPLLVLSIGLGGLVLVPAWFVWMGLCLRRASLTPPR